MHRITNRHVSVVITDVITDHDIRTNQFWGFNSLILNLGLPFLDVVELFLVKSWISLHNTKWL